VFCICSFYGWSLEYVNSLDLPTFYKALDAVEILKRRESLVKLKCSNFSNMQNNDRKEFLVNLQKVAYPNNVERVLTTKDLMNNSRLMS
jgi:hypothetical protein